MVSPDENRSDEQNPEISKNRRQFFFFNSSEECRDRKDRLVKLEVVSCVNLPCQGQLEIFALQLPYWVLKESALLWKPPFLPPASRIFRKIHKIAKPPASKYSIVFSWYRGFQPWIYAQVICRALSCLLVLFQTIWIIIFEGEARKKYILKAYQMGTTEKEVTLKRKNNCNCNVTI